MTSLCAKNLVHFRLGVNLLDQFEASARAAAATIERVPRDPALIAAAAQRAAPAAQRIAVAASRDLPAELLDACRALPAAFTGRSKSELASADLGITEAFAGVAASGSLCVSVDDTDTGYVSLLSRAHIAVLDSSSLVARVSDIFSRAHAAKSFGLERNFAFVTGPSATADMGPLVRGVHGPHRLHILVLE